MKLVRHKASERKASSALKRARDRLQARKQAAAPPEETFLEQAECSKTGTQFTVVWKRPGSRDRFTVRQIVERQNTGEPAGREAHAPSGTQAHYAVSEFDYTGYGCPVCNSAGGLIYCACGKRFCHGGTYMAGSVERCKVKSCGCDTVVGSSRTHNTGQAEQLASSIDGRKRITSRSRPRIEREHRELLGHSRSTDDE